MPYTMEWVVDKRVLYIKNSSELSDEEMTSFLNNVKHSYELGISPVHVIEDNRDFEGLTDTTLNVIKHWFKTTQAIDMDKLGWAVVIIPVNLETLGDVFGKIGELLTNLDYKRVETLPHALAFLAEHDATLPDSDHWHLPQS